MSDTLWSGSSVADDKLYLQSGEFESTIKTSLGVNGVDTQPSGISSNGDGNTLWCGNAADKLYLTNGQFGALNTSQAVGGIDLTPMGISGDKNGDTVWCGVSAKKLYLTSGQFTSTLKDSQAAIGGENPYGVSIDENENTLYVRSQVQDKLYLMSGEFTGTVKDSQNIAAIENFPTGLSYDGTDTPWVGRDGDKLYLTSGQFTGTLKTSLGVGAVNAIPEDIECADANIRLNLWGPPSGLSATDGHQKVIITFNPVVGATQYNLYWSDTSPVTILDTQIADITSGYEWVPPAGYDTGVDYYFAVTAYNAVDGETGLSGEVSGMPYWLDLESKQDIGIAAKAMCKSSTVEYYFACGSNGKIFRSTDAGENWAQVSATDGTDVNDICSDSRGWIYAGTEGGRIYYSSDNGANFNQGTVNGWRIGNGSPDPFAGESVRCLLPVGQTVYISGRFQGAWETYITATDDGGINYWVEYDPGLGIGPIIQDIEIDHHGDWYFMITAGNIYRYTPGVGAWVDISDAGYAPSSLMTTDTDGELFFLDNGGDELRYSSDYGDNWSTFTGAAMPATIDTYKMAYSYGLIYCAVDSANGRVYMTDLNETTFENVFPFTGKASCTAIFHDCDAALVMVAADNEIFVGPLPSPKTVTDLVATPGVMEVELTWTNAPGAITNTIYYGTSPGVTKLTGTPLNSIGNSPYTHTITGDCGIPYYYIITSTGCAGENVGSNEASATPTCGIPDAPTELTATATSYDTINVTWTAPLGTINYYNLYWSLIPGVTTSDNVITGISGISFDHIGRTSGVIYYYAVEAVGPEGTSALSNEDSAVCPFDTTEYKQMLWHLLPKGRFWQK